MYILHLATLDTDPDLKPGRARNTAFTTLLRAQKK